MCLQRICWPEYWLTLLWIFCLLRAPVTSADEPVKCERIPATALGKDVTLKCNFTSSFDVLQVTWQKWEGSSFKNIATYSKKHGIRAIGPSNERVCFNDTSLKASSITLRGVTLEDETCYKCLFNAFPHGSFGKETCLMVQLISAVRTELHSNVNSPGFLTAVCSATAKPAPEITWKPEGALIGQPEIHGFQNANGTETMISTCNVSMSLLRSENLQALTCVVNHPMGREEKIIFSVEEYEEANEKNGIHICPVLCISFILTAIGVVLIILAQMKRKENKDRNSAKCLERCWTLDKYFPYLHHKPRSSRTPCTPAEKKHLSQDGDEKHQQQPTPKSQSISYQNEVTEHRKQAPTPGSSQRKRTGSLKTKESQRGALLPRSVFPEGKEKYKEANLNHSFLEGIEEIDDKNF
ncbi:OX-2 membrane glycoprotein-like [Emydura macquarii macquarii]|uniref:OX-2 membrane glycoprotein-like n=1 Tax=Emydura macquarii macquarii TaxID=1129001 RepID=UPI00352BB49F